MNVGQLPEQVLEFARYLNGLVGRLDRSGGWYEVFRRRDPDGIQACLEGREVPPWDVVEALLQDVFARYGERAADRETVRARALHADALAAYDARPGGRDALGDRLDVMLREQRYAAERRVELGELLPSARSREQAEAIRLDLAWAEDDHERATARCAELRHRMTTVDDQALRARAPGTPGFPAQGAGPGPRFPTQAAGSGSGFPTPNIGSGPGFPAQGAGSGPGPSAPGRGTGSGFPARGAGSGPGFPAPGIGTGAPGTGPGSGFPAPGPGSGSGFPAQGAGSGPSLPAPSAGADPGFPTQGAGEGTWPQRPSDPAGLAGTHPSDQPPWTAGRLDGGPPAGDPPGAGGVPRRPETGTPGARSGSWPGAYEAHGGPAASTAPGGHGEPRGRPTGPGPGGGAEPGSPFAARTPGHDGAPAARPAARAPEPDAHPFSPLTEHRPDAHPSATPPEHRPGADPSPAKRSKRRRRGSARFAGMEESDAVLPVVPETGPVLPAPPVRGGRTPRGARFAGAAEEPVHPRTAPEPEPLGERARQLTADTVAALVRLRGEGRSGEAHVLLAEAAYWPPAHLPLLAAELHRAGLDADWATLLWEAASLPAGRLVAAADALAAAGRAADARQMLRQGVTRPAPEIGAAVLSLAEEGRGREITALLDAYVRVRTPEEAARSAEADPERLVPLLLRAARGVSDACQWDLVHALRVAGFTA
ncbi:hypothetical protein ACWD4F_18025 [Streptomyces aureus]